MRIKDFLIKKAEKKFLAHFSVLETNISLLDQQHIPFYRTFTKIAF